MSTATLVTAAHLKQNQNAVEKIIAAFVSLFGARFKRETTSWSDGPQTGL